MNNADIVSLTRTAVGKFGGSLKDFSPGQLVYVVMKDALKRGNVEKKEVEAVMKPGQKEEVAFVVCSRQTIFIF